MGEMSIRHRCAFVSICALTNDLVEVQNDDILGDYVGTSAGIQGICDGPTWSKH